MKYRVLVVDDQALPRQIFENIITNSEEFELTACIDSARVADLYCARGNVDLVLMDVVMNDGSNGIDAAEKIKSSYPGIKVIIVTSMPDSNFLSRAHAIGVDSFWYKEIQKTPLLELMRRTMAGEHIYPDAAPEVKLGLATSSDFTEREMDVLRELVQGYTDKEIAQKLDMSYHTIRFHINNLLGKTGCTTRTELAIRTTQSGLIVPEL